MSKCRFKPKNKSQYWPCFLENKFCEKNRKWTCIHELKCLYLFKTIKRNNFYNKDFFKDLVKDNNFNHIGNRNKTSIIKSRKSSIQQKIYNMHYFSINNLKKKKIQGLGSRSNYSKTTEKILKKCKDWGIEELKEEIKKLENKISSKDL